MSKDTLRHISPDEITENPDNPRLFFRPEELATLMTSISKFGIKVPISVYPSNAGFTLIDGERRWRCAKKLNLRSIPAIVEAEPTPLQNLLLMFNIHALREQWDYLTIANKLPQVIDRFTSENDGRAPNERELSELTGLTRGQIRRCNYLLELPEQYKRMLLKDLALPKGLQTLSEDLFIEMERALRTVEIRVPSALPDKDRARRALIGKFRDDVIKNITDFRKLSKIATSIDNVGVEHEDARSAIRQILTPNNDVSIQGVFAAHFEIRYDERKFSLHLRSIADYLETIASNGQHPLNAETVQQLHELRVLIDKVLKKVHDKRR